MSRWRAFVIHLVISLIVIGSIGAALFVVWYPQHLLGFAKADQLLLLIGAIDVIVGPLLTLIVFKAGKRTLKFDLAVIALLQIAFLSYGLWTAWQSRPVFLVAAVDRYELVFAHEVEAAELEAAPADGYRSLPMWGPELVGVRRPATREEFELAKQGSEQGREMAYRPRFYVPIAEAAPLIAARGKAIGGLSAFSTFVDLAMLDRVSARFAGDQAARFVPITSSRGSALMKINAESGYPEHYVD